jgi:predicted transglutaminase-like cysteine proteinase
MQTRFSLTSTALFKMSLLGVVLLSVSACAETTMPSATSMRLGAAAFAPQGYLKFCERRPDQCGLPSPISGDERIKLERVLNQQQWANVLNLAPTSTAKPAAMDLTDAKTAGPGDDDFRETGPAVETTLSPKDAAPDGGNDLRGVKLDNGGGVLSPTASALDIGPAASRTAIHVTPLVWAALNGVNQSINDKIRPMSDEQAFGVSDYWTLPLSEGPRPVGNCKHYALEKRKALVEAGFSPDALSIAIVKTGWGEVHAVLIVGTDKGDYVLDNLTPFIRGWQDVHYTWIERQTPGAPLRWAALAKDQIDPRPARTS